LSEWFLLQAGTMKRFDKMIFYLERELHHISREILEYGRNGGFAVGTTATIFLTTGKQFAILHVGDTRVYRITKKYRVRVNQITNDHSVNDYMLTQSVGAVDAIVPDIIRGRMEKNEIFLLCTDGFRHKNSPADLKRGLNPEDIRSGDDLEKKLRVYVDRARGLGENDDISVLAVMAQKEGSGR
ncbi:MAG: protein phosphatase 2C domain-containing protein, partial [Alistipes sp.]|nr:protein phosphatase 2C domain-containing protein [Alistipes sp.]